MLEKLYRLAILPHLTPSYLISALGNLSNSVFALLIQQLQHSARMAHALERVYYMIPSSYLIFLYLMTYLQ